MVRIGIVGIGFMGMIHYVAAQRLRGARVTAICSRDAKKLGGDWRGIQGNFGPAGTMMDLSAIQRFDRLETMLADPDVDLIDVCNPTGLHRETAVRALLAGKHVLVEKPIALRTQDADDIVVKAAAAKRILMVAHVLPFFPEFAYAERDIREQAHGKLRAAHFKRITSRPEWSAEAVDANKSGGPAIDLHIHDTHFIALVCGVPRQVFSTGVVENDVVQYLTTQYRYGDGGPSVSCSSGAISQKGRPFVHGFELYFEDATVIFEAGMTPLTVLTADGHREQPKLDGSDDPIAAFSMELQTAVDGVLSGREPALLGGKLARDALVMCHREIESVRTGQIVDVR